MSGGCGRSRQRFDRGQSLVEFAVIVPVFMLILIGLLEFGLMLNHHLTLQYATREGARTGAAVGSGGDNQNPCNTVPPDPQIVAAVQRILEANGSPIVMASIGQIRIYKADTNGNELGPVDTWTYNKGAGPPVDGQNLDFVPGGTGWPACSRSNIQPADSVGVSISYTYNYVTPLAAVLRFFGGPAASSQQMTDHTVMALNP